LGWGRSRGVCAGAAHSQVVDASTLAGLDDEARSRGFNRHHGPGWLVANADMSPQHYLNPFMVHRADHRPQFSPHWRCMLLLRMRDGQEVFSLLGIWPPTFMQIPELLTIHEKTELARSSSGGDLSIFDRIARFRIAVFARRASSSAAVRADKSDAPGVQVGRTRTADLHVS
jgi:hypothetical protein